MEQQAEDQARKETGIVDQDGYQVVKRSRAMSNFTPEIFAVEKCDKEGSPKGSRVRILYRLLVPHGPREMFGDVAQDPRAARRITRADA